MSTWTINGEPVLCRSVELGLARTDTAEAELLDAGADEGGSTTAIVDGAWVTLRCDGVPVLHGRASVGRSADGRVTVDIRGLWELLEAVTYQQTARMAVPHAVDAEHPHGYALTGVLTPETQLGMDDSGEVRTTLQEARAIMDYAASAGVPVAFSASFAGMAMRPVPVSGGSCAACLLTVMRFHPDVLLYFDYSGGDGAVLMARPAGDGPVVTYSGTGGGGGGGSSPGAARVTEARFRQRTDHRPAGVRILYTRVRADGRIESHTDTAGDTGGQGRGAYVINWPVRLEGPSPPPLLTQRVRTRPIPRSDDPAHPELDETELKTNWWQSRLPWLRLPGVAEIVTISGHIVSVDPPDITPSEDETEDIPVTWSEDPGDYPRELVDGVIPPWLPRSAAPLTISAVFTLGDPAGLSGPVREKLDRIFGGAAEGAELTREARVTGTDASTREYTALASWPEPPAWPAGGIASAYLAAFGSAVWEGGLVLTGQDQPLAVPGLRINVTGPAAAAAGAPGWAAMNAIVRSVSHAPLTHRTTLGCGAPDNFGFGDFYELQLLMRRAAGMDARAAAGRRARAVPADGGRVPGAGFTPNRSVSTDDPRTAHASGGLVPWTCDRPSPLVLRVWPAALWDGQGNHFQPLIGALPTVAEAWYEFEVTAAAGPGCLYLECTVSDAHDLHGLLTAVSLKLDHTPHEYFQRSGSTVLIPICDLHAAADTFTFTPLRSYVLCLRRYGPPGSPDWDVTPM